MPFNLPKTGSMRNRLHFGKSNLSTFQVEFKENIIRYWGKLKEGQKKTRKFSGNHFKIYEGQAEILDEFHAKFVQILNKTC